jgi:hypothetical protein
MCGNIPLNIIPNVKLMHVNLRKNKLCNTETLNETRSLSFVLSQLILVPLFSNPDPPMYSSFTCYRFKNTIHIMKTFTQQR